MNESTTGVTTVTSTASDTAGNTASCSFTVRTFDIALQDDSKPGTIMLWNSITGAYRFCCNDIAWPQQNRRVAEDAEVAQRLKLTHYPLSGLVDSRTSCGIVSLDENN